jgi:hypothetical protein
MGEPIQFSPHTLNPSTVFCEVLETLTPLKVLVAPLGAVIAGPRERRFMELGLAQYEAKQAARKRRLALEALKEIEP